MSRPSQDELDREVAAARELIDKYPHGTYGVTWVFALTALADDLKAAREEHLTSDLAGLRLAERVTALTADRDSWRRVCETLQTENDAMAALLSGASRFDCMAVPYRGEFGDGGLGVKKCAPNPDECHGCQTRAILASRAKRMGD